ncbi:MAG: type IV secretion system protein TraC [Lamprocystis purpurea]|uniref:type IV secretion system protein TraC n=1 Tax=Lamprocystis purpurea TaxID=61598 RepID=UPI00036D0174|nr:type IV secretion system protein TraC [Lamprocystis purpurea]MBV5272080.1 type IV secretion system protein TraC [Lamprocystis purpurea]
MSAHHFTGQRAANLFPALAFDPEQQLFLLDDRSVGFGYLCEPLASGDRAQADRLSVLINLDWPPDTLMQVILWTSPDLEEKLARMQVLRLGHGDDLLRASTRRRAEFLRAGANAALGPGSDLRLRDLQVIVTVKLPLAEPVPTAHETREATELYATAFQVLHTAGLRPVPLSADRYVRLMATLLNWDPRAGWRDRIVPECDPHRLIREQFLDLMHAVEVDSKGINLGGHRAQTLSVKRFPDRVGFGMAARYLGDALSGSRGIRHPVLITLNLRFPDAEAARVKLTAGRQWANHQALGPLSTYLPALAYRRQGFETLFKSLDNGDRPVHCYLGLVLFAPREEANAAASNLRTYWRELGFQVMPDQYFALPLFLHCLPFGADRDAIPHMMRYRTLAASHATALLPVFGDWKGTGEPVLNLVGRNGQLMDVNLFDSLTNYNAVVAASSGSGKSFLANEIIATNLSVGGRCWVIDVGRSYQNLCEAFDGQFIAFTQETQISLNPFDLIRNWEEEADVIAALVTAMAAPTEPLSDFQTAGIKRVLKELWDSVGHGMTIDAIAQALGACDDPRLTDVGQQLYPFTTAGEYGRYFHGRNSIAFDKDLVVLELEELKGRKHLQQVILLQLIYQIQQVMYLGDRGQPKLVFIDEAWDLLTHGDVAKFIEAGYRRFRKYNGAAITVTQSLNDLYSNPTGRAIADNSAHTMLLAQPAHAIDQLRAENRLPMSEGGAELLKTVHTVPGAYSEIMLLTDRGAGIGRLVVDPFRRLLYSTRPSDVAAIRELRAQGLSVADAINRLLEGTADDLA